MQSGDNTELTKTSSRDQATDIDLAGCQHESLPEFFHKLVTPTQLKSIDEARDFRQHWQLRIHVSGCIRNQILPKRIFTVPDYKGRKHNSLPLSLKLVLKERVPVKIQHPPTRCLETKLLIAKKRALSFKVPDDLVLPVRTNRHILPTHSAIKLAPLTCSISGPGDETLSQLPNSVPLLHLEGASRAHPSPRLLSISVLSTGVCRVSHTRLLLLWHGWPLTEFAQHLIKLYKQITDGETTELRSHTEQFRSTNWSSMDPADFSPPRLRNGRETPTDALWPESPSMKDLQSTDLKQEIMDYKHRTNEE